jgi:hypothetical protein
VAAKLIGGKRSLLDAHQRWLLELVAAEPDLTMEEIRGRLRARRIRVSARSGGSTTATTSLSEKACTPPNRTARTFAPHVQNWKRAKPRLDPRKLIFVDETGTSTNMSRLRGRCLRGKRLVAKVPQGH